MNEEIIKQINNGNTIVGIELGSTRIKAVLIDSKNKIIASGEYTWENEKENDIWTFSLDRVWEGLQICYTNLKLNVKDNYGVTLTKIKSLGISGMMHGYLVFDKNGKQLSPFRTWRNNITKKASEDLTAIFNYPIPQRWSISHLYQSIINGDEHVKEISQMTTLAGYVHFKLTGKNIIGICDASGMFPIDLKEKNFNSIYINKFDKFISNRFCSWNLKEILPQVLTAGNTAGTLTEEGSKLLDPSGDLESGISLCPPEGDAGTGMVATNSISIRTGNVSAGTSVFVMIVLDKELTRVHKEIDLITTPAGDLVAMAHSNNCTSDLDAWVSILGQAVNELGFIVSKNKLYDTLLNLAQKGDPDCGGLLSYGYLSGEHMTGFSEGRPLFCRSSNSKFTLENFIRTHLYSSLCALRTGINILVEEENVTVDVIKGHGGFFKIEGVGQKIMAAATNTPISVSKTAGEGGAWGIALLASYSSRENNNESLSDFLNIVFADNIENSIMPNPSDVKGFQKYFDQYQRGLTIERKAVESLH